MSANENVLMGDNKKHCHHFITIKYLYYSLIYLFIILLSLNVPYYVSQEENAESQIELKFLVVAMTMTITTTLSWRG